VGSRRVNGSGSPKRRPVGGSAPPSGDPAGSVAGVVAVAGAGVVGSVGGGAGVVVDVGGGDSVVGGGGAGGGEVGGSMTAAAGSLTVVVVVVVGSLPGSSGAGWATVGPAARRSMSKGDHERMPAVYHATSRSAGCGATEDADVEPSGPFDVSWIVWAIVVVAVVVVVVGVRRLWRRVRARLIDLGVMQLADRIEAVLTLVNDPAPHDLAVITPDHWPAPQRELVEARLAAAADVGFLPLGDIEDRTVVKATGAWATMRALVHTDGRTTLTAVARPNPTGTLIASIECGSELSDGRFVETIATDEPVLNPGPSVILTRVPASTSVAELCAKHDVMVREALGAGVVEGGVVSVLSVDDIDGLIQRGHRRLASTAAARAAVPGGISRDELTSLAPGVDPGLLDRLHQELIRRQEARSAQERARS
jgi:hypothetical protein